MNRARPSRAETPIPKRAPARQSQNQAPRPAIMTQVRRVLLLAVLILTLASLSYSERAYAQRVDALGPQVRKYLSVSTPKVILEHVQIIDGTGAAPSPDQNIYIAGGKIAAVSP